AAPRHGDDYPLAGAAQTADLFLQRGVRVRGGINTARLRLVCELADFRQQVKVSRKAGRWAGAAEYGTDIIITAATGQLATDTGCECGIQQPRLVAITAQFGKIEYEIRSRIQPL